MITLREQVFGRTDLSRSAERWCLIVVIALLVASRLMINWHRPMLDMHAFRQTQTAITAYWYAKDGVDLLRPPLPIFGAIHPSIPMEFPAYQAMIAWLIPQSQINDNQLITAVAVIGRLINLAFYLLTGLACWWLIRQEVGRLPATIFAIFWAFFPNLVFWSSTVTIEFMACFPAILYTGASWAWLRRQHQADHRSLDIPLLVLGVLAGVAGSLVKVTTVLIYMPLILVLGLWYLRLAPRPKQIRILVGLGLLLGMTFLTAWGWTAWSDSIKIHNTLGGQNLTSAALKDWNFGTVAYRLDPILWVNVLRTIGVEICVFVFLFVGGWAVWSFRKTLLLWVLLLPILVALTVFFNLYGRHDYYWIAITPSITIILVLGICHMAQSLSHYVKAIPAASLGLVLACGFLVSGWGIVLLINQAGYAQRNQPMFLLLPFTPGPTAPQQSLLDFADLIHQEVTPDKPFVLFGDGYASILPFYSQRQAICVTNWQRVCEQGDFSQYELEQPRFAVIAYTNPCPVKILDPSAIIAQSPQGVILALHGQPIQTVLGLSKTPITADDIPKP